jgi:hypothetical protein
MQAPIENYIKNIIAAAHSHSSCRIASPRELETGWAVPARLVQ